MGWRKGEEVLSWFQKDPVSPPNWSDLYLKQGTDFNSFWTRVCHCNGAFMKYVNAIHVVVGCYLWIKVVILSTNSCKNLICFKANIYENIQSAWKIYICTPNRQDMYWDDTLFSCCCGGSCYTSRPFSAILNTSSLSCSSIHYHKPLSGCTCHRSLARFQSRVNCSLKLTSYRFTYIYIYVHNVCILSVRHSI